MSLSAPVLPRRSAGRPPKIKGGTVRKWLYVSAPTWTAAGARAARDGVELPDMLRAMLGDYAAGRYTPTTEETS